MATITVDNSTIYQTMRGWQAVAEIGQISFPSDYTKWQDEVINLAVNEVGINRLMVRLFGADIESVNDNADPNSINWPGFDFSRLDQEIDEIAVPMRTALAARGESLQLNVKYISSAATVHTGDEEEYAELLEAAFLYLDTNFGFVPDSIDIMNEPTAAKDWTATKIGDSIIATATRLASHGWTPFFCACSHSTVGGAITWFDDLKTNVPSSLDYLEEISYHCYTQDTDANLSAIGSRAISNGKRVLQGEMINRGHDNLYRDLTLARVSAWEQFALAFPTTDNGAQYIYITNPTDPSPTVSLGSATKYLTQYMNFIRDGAIRISASSDDGDFDPTAFVNENLMWAVVVNCASSGDVDVDGLPDGTYGVRYTTASNYAIDASDEVVSGGGTLSTSIPAAGVITIYGKTGCDTEKMSYNDTENSNSSSSNGVTTTTTTYKRTYTHTCVEVS